MTKHIFFENNMPIVEKNYFDITCHVISKDYKNLKAIINQGIDSRLTGFTLSKINNPRLYNGKFIFSVDYSEIEILIRRLLELNNNDAERLADDIIYSLYGKETI